MWEPKTLCCCNVRIGTIIIAVVVLVCSITDAVVTLLGLPPTAFAEESQGGGCRELDQMFMDENECLRIISQHQYSRSVIASVHLVTDSLLIVLSSMLIHGVRKNKPCLVIPFMVLQGLAIVSVVVGTIMNLVAMATEDLSGFFVMLIFGPVVVFLMIYLFFVVRSCHLEVRRCKMEAYTTFHDEVGITTPAK